MPACRQCGWLDPSGTKCSLNVKPRCAIRNCIHAIAMEEIAICQGKVLEVGYGVWKTPRRELSKKGCQWFGVDPRWDTVPEKGEYKGTVSKMPFEDNFFDHALAFECMEHWMEYGDSPTQGLAEINRVLKPKGSLLVSVPIHLHGGDEFIKGDLPTIFSYFYPSTPIWDSISYAEWRKDYEPLPPALNWQEIERTRELVRQHSTQPNPSTWTLQIRAIKVG